MNPHPLLNHSETVDIQSVFTTLRWPWHPNMLKAHLQRLAQNAQIAFQLSAPKTIIDNWKQQIKKEHAALPVNHPPQRVRFTIHANCPNQLELESTLWQPEPISPKGLSLLVLPYTHPHPTLKHNQRGRPNQLKKHAQQEGFDDLIWENTNGQWTESTYRNLFIWTQKKDKLFLHTAHPTQDGCLSGIARECILNLASTLDYTLIESAPTVKQIASSTHDDHYGKVVGGFLSNSIQGCQPIGQITYNNHPTHETKTIQWNPIIHPIQTALYNNVWDILTNGQGIKESTNILKKN